MKLLCPACSSPLHRVLDTRDQLTGRSRRRQCANGHTVKTLEVVIGVCQQGGARANAGPKFRPLTEVCDRQVQRRKKVTRALA